MVDKPWYYQGLRFECTQCGNCCTGCSGYVWVNKQEVEQLTSEARVADSEKFKRMYVRNIGIRKSLREYSNGDCIFFDNKTRTCTVYKARPRQCRTWPFWHSNLCTRDAWKETCKVCPGSGTGKLYQLGAIEQNRKVIRI